MTRLFASTMLLLAATGHAADITVYFGTGSGESKGIYRAQFNTETGRLAPAELAAEIGSPGFLAFHPDRKTLYAVGDLDKSPCVAAYRIAESGALEFLNSSVISDGGAAHISVHPSGKFLLTAQYGGGSVALFPVAADGRVGEQAQLIEHEGGSGVDPKRQEAPHPHWCGFSPDGKFAFVPDLGLDQIVIYRVDADKPSITAHGVGQSVPGGGPRHMRFSVDGKFIYLLNELSLSVTTFAYDAAAGTAKQLTTVPALSEEVKAKEVHNSSSEIVVHPNGRFVYSGNRGNDTVTVYEADPATGVLKVVEVEPIRGAFPRNINLDASGKWLLVAGADSNTVSVFAIDQSSGTLTFQRGEVINVPGPICILFRE